MGKLPWGGTGIYKIRQDFQSETLSEPGHLLLKIPNRNGSAADIEELEPKLFRQMDGIDADPGR